MNRSHPGVMVLVLSVQAKESGLLFHGPTGPVEMGEEPLANAVLRNLRERGIEIRDGDMLFFPDGSPRYRVAEVEGDGFSNIHGWSV